MFFMRRALKAYARDELWRGLSGGRAAMIPLLEEAPEANGTSGAVLWLDKGRGLIAKAEEDESEQIGRAHV